MQQAFAVMLLERRAGKTIDDQAWEEYLRQSFEANKPLDQLIRELLSADGTDPATRPAMKFFLARSASDHKLLSRDVSRLLLGRNLECAQCHDHPSIKDYKQSEFYGLVAFLQDSYLYQDKKRRPPSSPKKDWGQRSSLPRSSPARRARPDRVCWGQRDRSADLRKGARARAASHRRQASGGEVPATTATGFVSGRCRQSLVRPQHGQPAVGDNDGPRSSSTRSTCCTRTIPLRTPSCSSC